MECRDKKNTKDIVLTEATYNSFKAIVKKGVYKELKERNLISDVQLNLLMKKE